MQSIVLHGSGAERFARCQLLSFGAGDARAVLTRLVTEVSSADELPTPASARRQFALSASGLRALGLADPELAQFSREFRQGMAHPERALALGDVAGNSPEHWQFGGPNTAVIDALWLTLCNDAAHLDELSAASTRLFARFAVSERIEDAALAAPSAAPALAKRRWFARVPAGEFVLGEADAVGERVRGPFVAVKHSARPLPPWVRPENALDFGRNGSYLVLRKQEPGWVLAVHTELRHQYEFKRAQDQQVAPGPARMRGGGYFFLPSLPALNYLAEGRG